MFRLTALVLLVIAVNQINDQLLDPTWEQAFLFWVVRPAVLFLGLWIADEIVSSRFSHLGVPAWFRSVVLVTLIGLAPLALVELTLEQYLPFREEFLDTTLWNYSPILAYLNEYTTLASIVLPLHLLVWMITINEVATSDIVDEADSIETPSFLVKANLSLESVLALHAEEHYVRVHHADGAVLLHYRFGDAVKEMPNELGMQVHRSWWVAEHAVKGAVRGTRRWQLELSDSSQAPVSDSYIKIVRDRGWLRKTGSIR